MKVGIMIARRGEDGTVKHRKLGEERATLVCFASFYTFISTTIV
jgi:hypothetical protein